MTLRLFHVNLKGWLGPHQVNHRRNNEYNILLTSWIHKRLHNGESLKYNRLSKSSRKIYKNIPLPFKNKSQGFLLMFVEAVKPENFAHFPELIPCHFFNTRLQELQARFLCVTSSDMQGEMWLVYKSWHQENRFRGSSSQTLFSAETSDRRKCVCICRVMAAGLKKGTVQKMNWAQPMATRLKKTLPEHQPRSAWGRGIKKSKKSNSVLNIKRLQPMGVRFLKK